MIGNEAFYMVQKGIATQVETGSVEFPERAKGGNAPESAGAKGE